MREMTLDGDVIARLAGLRLPAPQQALSRPPRQAQPLVVMERDDY